MMTLEEKVAELESRLSKMQIQRIADWNSLNVELLDMATRLKKLES